MLAGVHMKTSKHNPKTDKAESGPVDSTYRGEIGRLPRKVRVGLSKRMEEGYPTRDLLAWLHNQPGVSWCLVEYFDGLDITVQNLSNWRRGGHQRWLEHEERRTLVRELVAEGQELAADTGGAVTGDHLSAVLMAEFAVVAQATLATITAPAARCARLEGLLGTLIKVRRQDCASARRAREAATEQELEEFQAQCARDWNKAAILAEGVSGGRAEREAPDTEESPEFKAVVAKFRPPAKQPAATAEGAGGRPLEIEEDEEEEKETKRQVEGKQAGSRLIKANQGSLRTATMGKGPRTKRQAPAKLQTPSTKAKTQNGSGCVAGGGSEKSKDERDGQDLKDAMKRGARASQAESRLIKAKQGSLRTATVGEAPSTNIQRDFKRERPKNHRRLQQPWEKMRTVRAERPACRKGSRRSWTRSNWFKPRLRG